MKKYLGMLIIFMAVEISLALYLTVWRENFWNAIANKESLTFIHELGVFLVVALGCCFCSGISGYLLNLSTIKWREKLNHKAIGLSKSQAENVNQRIQEDCSRYPELMLGLAANGVKALFYICVFSVSLVMCFHWWMLAILALYTAIGSICTSYIARPLIHLNYWQQRAEATYRNALTFPNFRECILLMLGVAKRNKKLTYFQQFYMQVAVVVPLIAIAPTYFSSAMTLGTLMRINSLSNTIVENMGVGITNWGQINMLLSCRRRLKEINII